MAAVVVLLMVLALIAFGIWFAYSRGYFSSEFCTTHPSPGLAPPCASTAFPAAPPSLKSLSPFFYFREKRVSEPGSLPLPVRVLPSRSPCLEQAEAGIVPWLTAGFFWGGGSAVGSVPPPQCSLFLQHHQQEGHLQPALAPQRGECAVPRSVTGLCRVPGGVVSPGGSLKTLSGAQPWV